MENMANTQYFKVSNNAEITVKDILEAVYIALTEKGYNPGQPDRRLYYVRGSDLCDKL